MKIIMQKRIIKITIDEDDLKTRPKCELKSISCNMVLVTPLYLRSL